jgi:Cu(I)/Ag(I) efflux system membrane fusion protein
MDRPTMSVDQAGPPQPQPPPEGEERPPAGIRTMALVRWLLVALMAVAALAAWIDHVRTAGTSSQVAGARFLCPMHPQIVADHKGECPICGMDLVPATGLKASSAATATGGEAAPAAAAQRYTCPMHPEFTSADPKERCPQCHMKLVAVAAPAAAPAGLAPVDLSADRVQLIGMRTAVVTREPLSPSIRAVGFVTASETGLVSVNTRFAGWIEELTVGQTGQLVQKDEVLASIYSPDALNAQQVFLNAVKWSGQKAAAQPVTSDLERDARQRLELLGVAPRDIDALAASGQPLRALKIRSPVRGYVARRSALRGLFVQSGTELFQLADLSTVWVLLDVYESEISRIKVGQQAAFEVRAYPGRAFSGRVGFIYPAINTGSRTLQARVELKNPSLELRPGMFGDVTLDLGAAEAVVIPSEALIDTGEQQYVFVDRGGGRFEPRQVKAGWSGNGKTAVLEGLAAGERIVTTANFLLDSESRLRAAVEGFAASPPARP